jgi:hypothetical protein
MASRPTVADVFTADIVAAAASGNVAKVTMLLNELVSVVHALTLRQVEEVAKVVKAQQQCADDATRRLLGPLDSIDL